MAYSHGGWPRFRENILKTKACLFLRKLYDVFYAQPLKKE